MDDLYSNYSGSGWDNFWASQGVSGTSANNGGDFWGSLTENLLSAGQKFFSASQNNSTAIQLQNINSNTIISVAKWLAIAFVGGAILKAVFTKIFK